MRRKIVQTKLYIVTACTASFLAAILAISSQVYGPHSTQSFAAMFLNLPGVIVSIWFASGLGSETRFIEVAFYGTTTFLNWVTYLLLIRFIAAIRQNRTT